MPALAHDLVFVSMENWDDIWRRNQFVCDELARRNPDRKILFVGLPNDLSNAVRAGGFSEILSKPKNKMGSRKNIFVTSPNKWLPNSLSVGRKINDSIFRNHVRTRMEQLGIAHPILWLNPHSAVHTVGQMGESSVIYDITDDWTTLSQAPWLTELIRQQDQELCRRANAVVVCSRRLYEMKKPLTDHLHLIPNGVNASHYHADEDKDTMTPDAAAIIGRWKGLVVGYVGTIHPDRIDVELLLSMAAKAPTVTWVLIGPNFLESVDMDRLSKMDNIQIVGPVSYRQVPVFMRRFDVCMTPHRITPFTESLNPIKLFEYFAVGKPVVSTPVAGFRDYPELVALASTADEFLTAVIQAKDEMPGKRQQRLAEADKNSWSNRVDQIEHVIGSIELAKTK